MYELQAMNIDYDPVEWAQKVFMIEFNEKMTNRNLIKWVYCS